MTKLLPRKLYTKICEVCNTEFSYTQYQSVEKTYHRRACSDKCRSILASRALKGRYIQVKQNTRDESKWEDIPCKNCGKIIHAQKSLHRKFCSHRCKGDWQKKWLHGKDNPNWKPLDQRKPYRTVSHKVRKDLICERSCCETCQSTEELQVHHINRNRGDNSPENLMLLCLNCHANLHDSLGHKGVARLIRAHRQSRLRKISRAIQY